MPDFILRVEGVNFGATVLNTQDISTTRGSSLALEVSVRWLERVIRTKIGGCEVLYAGASQAAFVLRDHSAKAAEDAARTVRAVLRRPGKHGLGQPEFSKRPPPAEYMPFVVDVAELNGSSQADVDRALDRAMVLNRRRQMRAPTVVPPEPFTVDPRDRSLVVPNARRGAVCPVDQTRPVSAGDVGLMYTRTGQFPRAGMIEKRNVDAGTELISMSARSAALRQFGRTARWQLYEEIVRESDAPEKPSLEALARYVPAQSFADIVAPLPAGERPPLSLRGKIAVLYFDGAGFGKIRKAMQRRGEGVGAFAARVRGLYEGRIICGLLAEFLKAAEGPTAARYTATLTDPDRGEIGHLRLETLMLGGEDLCIVVPAWLGWKTARDVLDWTEAHNKALGDEKDVPPMRLRCGALFCDHKTPIGTARALAYDLCEQARKGVDESNPDSVLHPHVIESVEVPDGTLEAQRERIFGTGDPAAFTFEGRRLAGIEASFGRLANGLPRSQLYKLIGRVGVSPASADKAIERALARSDRAEIGSADVLKALLPNCDKAGVVFGLKLLAELRDYVDPFDEVARATESEAAT